MNFTTATPAEIDTELAELEWQASKIMGRLAGVMSGIEYREERGLQATERQAEQVKELKAEYRAARNLMKPHHAEYTRRGGWTRFYMVMNNGGHLHSSMHCSTCRPTTQFAWMPEYSGSDEGQIVDMAGEDACTVCFPDAPVGQRSRLPFRVKEREEAEKARAEREAKKAKAAAEFIPYGRKGFKTLRAAENAAGHEIGLSLDRRYSKAMDEDHRAHLDRLADEDAAEARAIVAAIEAARPGYDGEALIAKKVAKEAKELRKYDHYTVPAEPAL